MTTTLAAIAPSSDRALRGRPLHAAMLSAFEYSPVIDTAVQHYGLARADAASLFDGLLQWLSAIPFALPGQPIQMVEQVDRLWHAFVLNTKLYRRFCDRFFGRFIDHDPLDQWSDGPITLLGDAAHAMYPRGGNGACQALVDARVVAERLATIPDPATALKAYEDERRETVNKIVLANRGEGYEVIRRIVAERTGGERFEDIEQVLPLAEADEIFSRYHKLVGQPRHQRAGELDAGHDGARENGAGQTCAG